MGTENGTKIDTHVHTNFSPDSAQDPEELVREAIARGLGYLAITDHQENEFYPEKWVIDFPRYFRELTRLQAEYAGKIELAIGVEIGYAPHCNDMAKRIVETYPFDTVVNSVHNIGGVDLYYDTFYEGKDKRVAYDAYLALIEDSVDVPYEYTQLGHIGYIARYARYPDRTLRYPEFASRFDAILRKIIARGVVLELNSSTSDGTAVTPWDVVRRYYELGGRRVTFASDAHDTSRLCEKYEAVVLNLKAIGFTELGYWKNKRYRGLKI